MGASIAMTKDERLFAAGWLAIWAVAVAMQGRGGGVLIFTIAAALLLLTWRMGRLPVADRLSLSAVDGRTLLIGSLCGCGLVLVYFICLFHRIGNLTDHATASAMVWSVMIAPVTEELLFRGIVYRAMEDFVEWFGGGVVFKLGAIGAIAIVFGGLHGRTSIFLLMTILAGFVFGLLRWKFRSAQPAIACHISYNAMVLILTGALFRI